MKILGTGLSGLVGSRIVELLSSKYEFESSTEDVTDGDLISQRIKKSDAQIILHLAAKTNVDGCEEDKDLGKEGDAWEINVEGTGNIARACLSSNKKLIYISTDFVFDGEKKGGYLEEDTPNPINWYGRTKYEGELQVRNLLKNYIIARIAYPYRAKFDQKPDFIRTLLGKLKNNEQVALVTDHLMVPTFVDDIANALDILITKEKTGIFHVVGSEQTSPYKAGLLIAKVFALKTSNIKKTTRKEFFKGRAQRGFNLYLKNDKIRKLGIKMRTLEEGLWELQN